MARSPQMAGDDVLRTSVSSGGRALADSVELFAIEVHRAIGIIPSALITLGDGDMPTGEWEIADASTFVPGAEIVIKAGYGSKEETIFEGIVVRLGARIGEDNESRLLVYCQDKAVKMTLGRTSANFIDKSDADIIKSLAGAHGLSSDVDSTQPVHRELVQYYCSDWDFVMTRAEANGLMVIADGGKLSAKTPDTSGSAAIAVTWGVDLFDFEADIDARSQLKGVDTIAWDPKNQAVVKSNAAAATLNRQGNLAAGKLADALDRKTLGLQSATMLDSDALGAWAKAQQVKAGLARIQGHMTFTGSAAVRLGGLVEVSGVGKRYEGQVFVGGLSHEISAGEWRTRVDFGLPPRWFAEKPDVCAPPAAGWLPGASGLQVGIVMKLDKDPAGEHRVQVEIPLLRAEHKGVWARLLQHYASKDFGAFYLPEIGDEVVIGYFNDDPSNPVILGSLYSSNRAPPYVLEAENNTKAIVTRSKAKIEIDDKDIIVTISTPAGNIAVLSDKDKAIELTDQHGNFVKLDENGITLDSTKDINMSAKGQITAKAGSSIAHTANSDITAKGMNVTVEAQAALACKGAASAEFSATGQTTVRGSIVMIN